MLAEREQELRQIQNRLHSLLLIKNLIYANHKGLEIQGTIYKDPYFPKQILEGINFQVIRDIKVQEDKFGVTDKLISRLHEFIEIYSGSRQYVEKKIKKLISIIEDKEP
jgi:hypothetical protein